MRTQKIRAHHEYEFAFQTTCYLHAYVLCYGLKFNMLVAPSLLVVSLLAGLVVGARWRIQWLELADKLAEQCRMGVATPAITVSTKDKLALWASLPLVVRKYFNNVFSPIKYGERCDTNSMSLLVFSAPKTRWLRFRQDGVIHRNNQWVSMSAVQTISNAGYVWQAEMFTIECWWKRWTPKVLVCDAWVHGKAYSSSSLQGVVPIATSSANRDHEAWLQQGEMMRFLADAFYTPTVLLPEAAVVSWKATVDENKAVLSMDSAVDGCNCKAEVTFTSDAILVSGIRPKVEEKYVVNIPWSGKLSNFQVIGNMWIPTRVEYGWKNVQTGNMDRYFVAENSNFEFDIAAGGRLELEEDTCED